MAAGAGSVALHHERLGQGDPVVLLHGQGGSGSTWDLQIEALAPRYHVVSVDLRGHGRSPAVPGPYSMAMLAGDVAALLRASGLGPCHVVGHSLGGMVALQLALDAPERVRSLAIVNSTAFGAPVRLRTFVMACFLRLAGMPAFARVVAKIHLPEADQAPLRARLIAALGAATADGYLAAQAAVDGFDVRARLGEIACPLLAVHSELDVIPRADKELIARRAQRGRLVCIPDSRHIVVWDQPARLSEALLAHLAEASQVLR